MISEVFFSIACTHSKQTRQYSRREKEHEMWVGEAEFALEEREKGDPARSRSNTSIEERKGRGDVVHPQPPQTTSCMFPSRDSPEGRPAVQPSRTQSPLPPNSRCSLEHFGKYPQYLQVSFVLLLSSTAFFVDIWYLPSSLNSLVSCWSRCLF